MKYAVEFSKEALKNIKRLDRGVASILFAWINKNLNGTDNPRIHGKALITEFGGLWCYRVGDHRLIAEIQDEKVLIVILEAGHRNELYDGRAMKNFVKSIFAIIIALVIVGGGVGTYFAMVNYNPKDGLYLMQEMRITVAGAVTITVKPGALSNDASAPEAESFRFFFDSVAFDFNGKKVLYKKAASLTVIENMRTTTHNCMIEGSKLIPLNSFGTEPFLPLYSDYVVMTLRRGVLTYTLSQDDIETTMIFRKVSGYKRWQYFNEIEPHVSRPSRPWYELRQNLGGKK